MEKKIDQILSELAIVRTDLGPLRFFFSHLALNGELVTDEEDLQALASVLNREIQRLDQVQQWVEELRFKT